MRLRHHLAAVIGCIGLMAMSLSASGRPLSPAQDGAQRVHTVMQVLPKPRPWRLRARRAYHVPSYVKRLVESSRPVMGWPALVTEARKYLGTNPTDRKRLWCATFMNLILAKLGYAGTNSDAARSFAYYGKRVSKPEVGAIAVLTRGKRGGHVGVVSGIDAHGNPIIISGNHNRRVGEGIYPRSRVIAYVVPTRRKALVRRARHGHAPYSRAATSRAARWAPDRPLDFPITELLAAIRAERAHAEVRPLRRSSRRRQARMPRRVLWRVPD